MKYLPDERTVCTSCYGIYSFYRDRGWMKLSFLGEGSTWLEAEEKLRKYLACPENQSASTERYQIRLEVSSNIVVSEATWKPEGSVDLHRF